MRFASSLGKMTLNRVANVTVNVSETDEKVSIAIEGAKLPVNHFEFKDGRQVMTCALGTTSQMKAINQNNEQTPTGKWQGRQWTLEEGVPKDDFPAADFFSLKFATGIDTQERHLLYLRMIGRQKGTATDIGIVIRWAK